MTNKKFKLAAMSLATAVAVSTVGPSASAVTYYLGNGDITVDQDETRGAFSYQGEDKGNENRTYVNEDKAETGDGTIYVKDGNAPTGEVPPPLITPTMAQRCPHLRIMPHNPPMLLATTQRTAPRLRPQLETPSPLWKMSKRRKRPMAPKETM